jgi:putative acetyltransferase
MRTNRRLQILIREYQANDASAMARLFFESVRQLGLAAYTQEQLIAWAPVPQKSEAVHTRATDGRTTLIAVDSSGEIVGYGDLEPNGHIDHVYCRPDAAGRGVASQLVDQLLARAALAEIPRLFVEASELARALFEGRGFALTGRRDFVLRGTHIHNYAMELILEKGASDLPDSVNKTQAGEAIVPNLSRQT